MRMLHLVQSPPNILSRVRFLMGEESKGGGGIRAMCEDPATSELFTIQTTPLLYKEDEDFIVQQMHALFGIYCPNLIRIVDFSIHQVRAYNHNGFCRYDDALLVLSY